MNVLRPSASWIVMKPPPPRLPAAGKHHAERVADRDRGVDGVAALLQDVDADLGGEMLAGDDHAVARADGAGDAACALRSRSRRASAQRTTRRHRCCRMLAALAVLTET